MSQHKRASVGFWAGVTLGCLIAAPLLYLALLGPVYFLHQSKIISVDALVFALYPVGCLSQLTNREPVCLWSAFDDYMELWSNLAPNDGKFR